MLKAILFDLGDTLLDFEPMDTRALFFQAARETFDALAARNGRMPPFARYAKSYYRAVRWAYFRAKLTGREFNSLDLLRRFHRRMGLPEEESILREIAWMWYEPVVRHARTEEDLKPTLAALRGAGLKLAVVSNTFVPAFVHDRHLEIEGLLEFFDVRIYSSEVGFRKPNRRIFQAALSALEVAPASALFVGDLVKTDIIGARRAGMRTALKQPYSNPGPHPRADHVIHRISDLLRLPGITPVDPVPTGPAPRG